MTDDERRRIEEYIWTEVRKHRHNKPLKSLTRERIPIECTNSFQALTDTSTTLPPPEEEPQQTDTRTHDALTSQQTTQEPHSRADNIKTKKGQRLQLKIKRLQLSKAEEAFLISCIEKAEEERTDSAKQDKQNVWRAAEENHTLHQLTKPSIMSTGREVSYRARNFIRGIVNDTVGQRRRGRFALKMNTAQYFHDRDVLPPGKWRDGSAKAVPTHKRRGKTPYPSARAMKTKPPTPKKSTTPELTRTERRRLKKKTKRRSKRTVLRTPNTKLQATTVGGRRRCRHKAAGTAASARHRQRAKATTTTRQPPK